jgi:hypothetical protein
MRRDRPVVRDDRTLVTHAASFLHDRMAARVERQASGILYATRRPVQLAERTGYVAAWPRSRARAVSGRSDCEHGVAADLQHRCPQPHLPASGHVARRPFERKEKLNEHRVRRREAADQASDDHLVVSSEHRELIEPLPDDVRVVDRPRRQRAVVFGDDGDALRMVLAAHADHLAEPETLWVAYPKGNRTDINRDSVWPILAEYGLRPIGQAR